MPVLRVVILWHQHQPYYKDLVTGEYRLPWVRLHALKDYYGMVKLLDEFPQVHQTFNLVPSLIAQIKDYETGAAHDPFLAVASRPANDLTYDERCFALQYMFQANPVHVIGRYPRYSELWERYKTSGSDPARAEKHFQPYDFTDLQVLSQLAWFDEFFLQEPEVAELVRKGRGFSLDDQRFVIEHQRELIGRVLPAHAQAARDGQIEISTSAYYHPILPLVCDTNQGAASTLGLPLPQNRFRHPEDAREQLLRGLDLHENVFGQRPRGVWPSEGSVSEEVLTIASDLGVQWMATDEGVLSRTLGMSFMRDGHGRLPDVAAASLYTIHRYEKGATRMNLIFRDHAISDLIGFVYSGMPPQEAADHLMRNIRESAEPVLRSGSDALFPIILDGENAWEYYPESGREFLRRFYDSLQNANDVEAVTVSEAIARHTNVSSLTSLTPGSWINANFNVWIGSPEDNRSWDYLYHARNFYSQVSPPTCSEAQRQTALEELFIAEGSDWNWWYGPEHHSANDREFDELYRKHLSNVYQLLGATPPDYLAQPIMQGEVQPFFRPQSHYIRPRIDGKMIRYFEWMGAAHYTADRRSSSMHGKVFLLDSIYAGIDESNIYGRVDFATYLEGTFEFIVNLESWAETSNRARRALRLKISIDPQGISSLELVDGLESLDPEIARAAFADNLQFSLPLELLYATPPKPGTTPDIAASKLRLRFSIWQNGLPLDALPVEGWIELQLVTEQEMALES